MVDRKEVELLVRAKLQGAAKLNEITKGIEELGVAIDKQTAAAKKGEGSIKSLETTLQALKQVQDQLGDQASLIGAFQRQAAAVEKTTDRVAKAGAAHDAYKSKLASVALVTEAQQNRLVRLAAAHERAQAAQVKAQATLAGLEASLKQAGIATDQLAASELRVRNAAALIGTSINKAQVAIANYTADTKKAAAGTNTLTQASTNLRASTASVADAVASSKANQALRAITSQVLSLVAAYTGLQSATRLAGGAVEAINDREAVQNQLSLSVGNDRQAIDAELAYIKKFADTIGIESDKAAKGYAKLSASARLAGQDQQTVRFLFEAFAEVGRVAGLSGEEIEGVFRALGQSFSKGKVQTEELLQIAERVPGVLAVAQQALKAQFPDLQKALKEGKVGSEQLVLIAESYRQAVSGRLAQATKGLAADQARLTNAVQAFKLVIADAGFADKFADVVQRLTAFLQSDDGKRFAQSLASGFATAGDVLLFLLRNLDTVKLALGAIVALWASNKLRQAAGGIFEAAAAMRGLGAEATIAQKAFAGLQAFIVGFGIGQYLNEEFEGVRKFGVALVVGFAEVFSRIQFGAKYLFEELPRYAGNAAKFVVNTITQMMRNLLGVFRAGAQAVGMTDLADGISRVIDGLTFKYEEQGQRAKQIAAEMRADIERIQGIGDDLFKAAERRPGASAVQPAGVSPTARPTPGKPGPKVPTEAEINKRKTAIEAIQRQLETLDAGIDRAAKASLSLQLDAVDTQFAKLQRDIDKIGTKTPEGAKFTEELERLKGREEVADHAGIQCRAAARKRGARIEARSGRRSGRPEGSARPRRPLAGHPRWLRRDVPRHRDLPAAAPDHGRQ